MAPPSTFVEVGDFGGAVPPAFSKPVWESCESLVRFFFSKDPRDGIMAASGRLRQERGSGNRVGAVRMELRLDELTLVQCGQLFS